MLAPAICRTSALMFSVALMSCSGSVLPKTATPQPVQHQRFVRVLGKVLTTREDGTSVPLPNALVAVVPTERRGEWIHFLALMPSDANGRFSFDLAPGSYTISATLPGFVAFGARVSASYESATPPIELHLAKEDAHALELHGTLLDAQRKPQANARVAALRMDSRLGEVFLATSDAEGGFHMTVPKAKYALVSSTESLTSREIILPPEVLNAHSSDLILLPKVDPPASDEVVAWLRERAVPLERVGDDIRIPDVGVLRIIGNARVVGLGESAHGGHEFALTKVRLFQTLAEKANFSVFAIEASHTECADIDHYVQTGEGDPALLLSRLRFWVTDIDELLGLIKWMRAYNADASHAKKLHFAGFDLQFAPRAATRLLEYLERVDPKLEQRIAPALTPLSSEFEFENYRRLPQPVRARAVAAVDEVVRQLERHQAEYRQRASESAWKTARKMALTLTQTVQVKDCRRPACRPPDVRDKLMADNVLEMLHDDPGARMTLWAANAHIATESFLDWEAMGRYLRKALGRDYLSIGFTFNQGAVNAYGDDPFGPVIQLRVEPALPGSLDETLARVGKRAFIADLRALPGHDEAGAWLAAKHRTHDMGASYGEAPSDEYWPLVTPRDAYDAVIYLDEITPTRLRHPRPTFKPEAHAQPVNLDFDAAPAGGEAPTGWSVPVRSLRSGYRVRTVANGCTQGRACALVDRPGEIEVPHYGSLTQDIDAGPHRGQKIRVSANIRVERAGTSVSPQQAELWAMVLGSDGEILDMVGMPEHPITSSAWQRYSVTISVPASAARIRFGIAVDGNTRAWLDGVALDRAESDASGAR